MNLLGNLDCEAQWARVTLPEAVRGRISLLAALFSACADGATAEAPHQLWAPTQVDPTRLIAHPGWVPPRMHVGAPASGAPAPESIDLAWADPAARDANDRVLAHAIAAALGVALPGAGVVGSLDELDERAAARGDQPWIVKARWTAAGRDRARGAGLATGELRGRITRMLMRFGPLVFEPWLDRVADFGVCGELSADGGVAIEDPHGLICDPRGGFLGIDLRPAIDPGIRAALLATAATAAVRLAAATGYRGRFAVDAFTYRDRGATHLHPLCELNARHTFGWVARALARSLDAVQLGFTTPPSGAAVLIAPGADRVTAWVIQRRRAPTPA